MVSSRLPPGLISHMVPVMWKLVLGILISLRAKGAVTYVSFGVSVDDGLLKLPSIFSHGWEV